MVIRAEECKTEKEEESKEASGGEVHLNTGCWEALKAEPGHGACCCWRGGGGGSGGVRG